ncbi:neo-calmodulin-like [Bolinopsis microptera]|uniref:neo-calmodulin-like n=1 Tax=Bolinopsis microptera TaxID=2820187 RepID=UPI00307A0FA9
MVVMRQLSLEDIDNISPGKLKELRECFDTFDDDQNGTISQKEFQYALTKLNIFIGSDEVRDLFFEYDTNNDNILDFDEFIKLVSKLDPTVSQEIEINQAFKLFDLNQDGYITRHEVKEALTRFGITASEDEIDLLFTMTDDDKDGMINHAEFRNMLYDPPSAIQPVSLSSSGRQSGSLSSSGHLYPDSPDLKHRSTDQKQQLRRPSTSCP